MSRQLRKRARSSSRGPPSIETTDSLKMKKINSNNKKARKMRKKRLPIQATNTNNDDTKMQEEETLNDVRTGKKVSAAANSSNVDSSSERANSQNSGGDSNSSISSSSSSMNNANKKTDVSIPIRFFCPICRRIMQDPVVASDGQTYDRMAILQYFNTDGEHLSPVTYARFTDTTLLANHTLSKAIASWLIRNRQNNGDYNIATVLQKDITQLRKNFTIRPVNQSAVMPQNDLKPGSIDLTKFSKEIDRLIDQNQRIYNNKDNNVGGDSNIMNKYQKKKHKMKNPKKVSTQELLKASMKNNKASMQYLFDHMSEIELRIWKKLHFRELQCYPQYDYMNRQKNLNPRMRAILFDWMTEVCQEYQLKRETLHLALINVDRYLSMKRDLKRSKLQLVGVASLLIASKVEEIYAPHGSDFVATTDGAYAKEDIFEMEMQMLKVFDWKITPVTPFTWMNLYMRKIYEYCKLKYVQVVLKDYKNVKYGGGTDRGYLLLQKYLANKTNSDNKEGMSSDSNDKILSGVFIGDVVGAAAFPSMPFEKIMEKIDLLMLDMTSLRFTPSLIVATMLYQFLPSFVSNITKEEILKITKYEERQIKEVIAWSAPYLRSFFSKKERNASDKVTYRTEILPVDYYTMQKHHAGALKQYKRVWDETRMPHHDIKLRIMVHQYQGRSYEYDASVKASLKQLCEAHCRRFKDVKERSEMAFLTGPYLQENSEEIDLQTMFTTTIGKLPPNEAGYTEVYAIPKTVYDNLVHSRCIVFVQDMDTVEIKAITKREYYVEQKECHVFGIKKADAERNFEILKHILKKYADEQSKRFSDLIFVIDDTPVDFLNFGKVVHSNDANKSSTRKLEKNGNKKTPATAKKKTKQNAYNTMGSNKNKVTVSFATTTKTLDVLSNISSGSIIECYSRNFFEIVLDENGDGSSSAHNNDSSSDKLITNEILKFPTTPSVGYHNNSRGLNSGSFTP